MGLKDNSNIYMVLGMHRSGTSLVAGMLHHAGIPMGEPQDFYPPGSEENAKGFYENIRFRRINDSILQMYGYVVKHWNPTFRRTTDLRRSLALEYTPNLRVIKGGLWGYWTLRHRLLQIQMRKLLLHYTNCYKRWGWKDPRQMLTLFEWFREIENNDLTEQLRLVYIFRHPVSVANSMKKRGDVETLSHGLSMWYSYNHVAYNFIKERHIPAIFISYEDLIGKVTKTYEAFSDFAQISLTGEKITTFVTPELNRSGINAVRSNLAEIDPNIDTLYCQFLALSQTNGS